MKNKIILSLFVGLLTLSAIGCKHTANGLGKDMEDAGEKIQEKTN
jgi:predicted small secreted protein